MANSLSGLNLLHPSAKTVADALDKLQPPQQQSKSIVGAQ